MGAKACSCGRRPNQGEKKVEPEAGTSLMEPDPETKSLLEPETAKPEKEKADDEKSKDGDLAGQGFTECPALGTETMVDTEEIYLPNWHIMAFPKWQFSSLWAGLEINVFDPSVSNTTRMGYWRTVKTWGFRNQFAYVPEGSETPQVVVTVPFFAWTTEYNVELCPAQKHWKVKQNVWVWGGWFQHVAEYEIYEEPGEKFIAKAFHSKDMWGWHGWYPPGWKSLVKSEVEPGKEIGAMVQSVNHFWGASVSSTWYVVDEQPEMLSPTVLSFLAAAYDLDKNDESDDSHSTHHR